MEPESESSLASSALKLEFPSRCLLSKPRMPPTKRLSRLTGRRTNRRHDVDLAALNGWRGIQRAK
jgi:hypothetical protein